MPRPKAKSPNVQRKLELRSKLARMLAQGIGGPDGWVGFALNKDGTIEAGKEQNGMHMVATFEPTGAWAKEAERLRIEEELRAMIFLLSDEEREEYDRLRKLANQQG